MSSPGTTPEQPMRGRGALPALAPGRCLVCTTPTRHLICAECAETLAEQEVYSHE